MQGEPAGVLPLQFGEGHIGAVGAGPRGHGPGQVGGRPFEPLLAGEAAKITIGYVAYVGDCEAALDPPLDALRVCAAGGVGVTAETRRVL